MEDKNKDIEERVEAVPGPALVISKEAYEKMQEDGKTREKKDQPKSVKNLFAHIKRKKQMKELELLTKDTMLQRLRKRKSKSRSFKL